MQSKSWNRYLPIALFAAFLFAGLVAFFQSRPSPKNARIYKAVKHYSPYYLDKRFGGLTIKSKNDPAFKEKPSNLSLFKEYERLEREWAKTHLRIEGNNLTILDNNSSAQAKIPLQKAEELEFLHRYYRI